MKNGKKCENFPQKSQPRERAGDHNRFKSRQPVDWRPNYLYRTLLDFSSMCTKCDEHPMIQNWIERTHLIANWENMGKIVENIGDDLCVCVSHIPNGAYNSQLLLLLSHSNGGAYSLSLSLSPSLYIPNFRSLSCLFLFIEQVYIVIIKSSMYPAVKRSTFSSDKQIWNTVLCAMHWLNARDSIQSHK